MTAKSEENPDNVGNETLEEPRKAVYPTSQPGPTPDDDPTTERDPAPAPYAEAVEEYLEAADWLGPADAPLKVHALAIAQSLDRQLALKGEVQSALASSFDKVLLRLDKRRPPATPAPPGLGDGDGAGTPSMFGFLE